MSAPAHTNLSESEKQLAREIFDEWLMKQQEVHAPAPAPAPAFNILVNEMRHRLNKLTPPPPPSMPHASALFAEALSTINGPRRSEYGAVSTSFKRIALTWSAVLGIPVTPQQVCLCMIGLKLCRESNAHKHDNLTDLTGYTGLLVELEAETHIEKAQA